MESTAAPVVPPPTPTPRQGLAMASLVLGILGNLCLWLIASIPAIITGHMALNRAKRAPHLYGGAGMAIAGLVLGYLGLLVGAITTAILAGMLVPALTQAHGKAEEIKCINNLKMVGLGARIYATDHNDQFPPDFASMGPMIGDPRALICPGDTRRRPLASPDWSTLSPDNVSYDYLLPGAKEEEVVSQPVFRCPIHGHVVMGDGSVQRGQVRPR